MRAKVVRHERHRWFGLVELDNGLTLYMPGIAAWLFEGNEVELKIKNGRYSFGKEVYRYKILAREAVYERDFEKIAELEQYHYASQKSRVALWKCYD